MDPEPQESSLAEEAEHQAAPDPRPAQGWGYWDAALVVGFALGAQIFVYVLGLVFMLLIRQAQGGTFTYEEAMSNASFILPVQFAWWLLVFWIVYRIVRARDPRPFREAIGWVRPALPPGVYVAGGVALALSVAGLAWLIPMPRQKMPMELLFRDPTSAFLLAGFGVLIAPVVEELLFRGFFYPVIERAHGTVAAVMATGLLFSLVHAQQYGGAWQNLLLLAYVGVVFGVIRAVSGSLVPSTLVHAGYNLTLFAGLYAASNRFQNF